MPGVLLAERLDLSEPPRRLITLLDVCVIAYGARLMQLKIG
jgi:hypothetical protein